jgi:predicted metal-dependent hydrolase
VDDPFARGAELFDRGEFFEAHEAWEERWKVATNATERTFLQGLIQVAAAFHKLVMMKSEDAAARILAKGLAKLDAYPAHVEERGLTTFCERLRECADELAAGRLTRAAIPKITSRVRRGA